MIGAALTASYPALLLLAVIVGIRYASILNELPNPERVMVCALLVIVAAIAYEQILYGAGRLTGHYISWATNPYLVSIGKLLYMAGLSYKLYAFWLIAPTRQSLFAPLMIAFSMWACLFAVLVLVLV